VDRSYRIIFTFLDSTHVELRYIGHHHFIYDYDMFK
jgi:mRNA-degrading endonuclease RelE of RelBE toxin-antitoxin system